MVHARSWKRPAKRCANDTRRARANCSSFVLHTGCAHPITSQVFFYVLYRGACEWWAGVCGVWAFPTGRDRGRWRGQHGDAGMASTCFAQLCKGGRFEAVVSRARVSERADACCCERRNPTRGVLHGSSPVRACLASQSRPLQQVVAQGVRNGGRR